MPLRRKTNFAGDSTFVRHAADPAGCHRADLRVAFYQGVCEGEVLRAMAVRQGDWRGAEVHRQGHVSRSVQAGGHHELRLPAGRLLVDDGDHLRQFKQSISSPPEAPSAAHTDLPVPAFHAGCVKWACRPTEGDTTGRRSVVRRIMGWTSRARGGGRDCERQRPPGRAC